MLREFVSGFPHYYYPMQVTNPDSGMRPDERPFREANFRNTYPWGEFPSHVHWSSGSTLAIGMMREPGEPAGHNPQANFKDGPKVSADYLSDGFKKDILLGGAGGKHPLPLFLNSTSKVL